MTHPVWVPRQIVRAHVASLRDQGMGYRAIADAAGLHYQTVRNAGIKPPRGPHSRGVRWATAYKIMKVSTTVTRTVDATGTTRRLQALQALGWTGRVIGQHLGVCQRRAATLISGQAATVEPHIVDRVHVLYDTLAMTPGPSAITRARAAANGWVPPLAWDDDTIDDPTAVPYSGSERYGVDVDDIEWLLRAGETKDRIAERLGVSYDAIERACYRHARPDLAVWLRTGEKRAA